MVVGVVNVGGGGIMIHITNWPNRIWFTSAICVINNVVGKGGEGEKKGMVERGFTIPFVFLPVFTVVVGLSETFQQQLTKFHYPVGNFSFKIRIISLLLSQKDKARFLLIEDYLEASQE